MISKKETKLGFAVGDRVRLHPCSEWFSRGVREATVTSIGRKWIHVVHDRTVRTAYGQKGVPLVVAQSPAAIRLRPLEIVGRAE
jgi:hypothetical protein